MRIAISGFGRIGKTFLRALISRGLFGKDIEVVAINTRSDIAMHVHLFKYDSTFGKFEGILKASEDNLVINDYKIKWIQETDPLKLPWKELGVDLVLESSGEFTSREDAEKHIKAGAKYVLISAPAKSCDSTIVLGVNEHTINSDMKIFSLASCTTNCLAPVLKVLDERFGIEKGFMSTIHAYTNDQRILDGSHRDLRRARSAAINIIPTTTGAAKAIGDVLPSLQGKLDGLAFRVPVADGSINDITVLVKKSTTVADVNAAFKRASEEELKGILAYTEEPIVSSDVIGSRESAIVDGNLTKVMDNLVKVSAWYDNEFGYSNRLVDFVKKLSKR